MNYSGDSYKINYDNSEFDSALELTWYLFLAESGISQNINSQPFKSKSDLSWYPDLRFVIFKPRHFEILVEVKPLSVQQFSEQLDLQKYRHPGHTTLIAGQSNADFLLIPDNDELSVYLQECFHTKNKEWNEVQEKAKDYASKYGSKYKNQVHQPPPKAAWGKYKGKYLKEVEYLDPEWYKHYIQEMGPAL